jgi:hypothetical protein
VRQQQCSISNVIPSRGSQLHLISGIDGQLPFSLIDASRPDADFERPGSQFNRVHFDTRLNNRVVDLRVSPSVAS